MADIQLTSGDYRSQDWDALVEAAGPVFSAIADIVHHRMADGEWDPWAKPGDTEGLASEVTAILLQLEQPIKLARTELTRVETAARLRAMSRGRRASRNTPPTPTGDGDRP